MNRQELRRYLLRNEITGEFTNADITEAAKKFDNIENAVEYLQGIKKAFDKYAHVNMECHRHKEMAKYYSDIEETTPHNGFVALSAQEMEKISEAKAMKARHYRQWQICKEWLERNPR